MREDQLITEVRFNAQMPDSVTDYPDARIRVELNSALQKRFAPVLVAARCGMLLKRFDVTMVASTAVYAMPNRAMAAGFECLDLNDGTTYWALKQIEPSEAWKYETSTTGRPQYYTLNGSTMHFYPTPSAAYTLRCQYYLRPSLLVQKQTYTIDGQIQSINTSARTITIAPDATFLYDRITAATVYSNRPPIDVIRVDGYDYSNALEHADSNYEAVMVSVDGYTIDASTKSTFTFPVGTDLTEVRVGDLVRVFNQSEWPMLPHEYHSSLAMAAAAKICKDRGMYNAASELDDVVRADLQRMQSAIEPRVKSEAKRLRPAAHMLRRGIF